jgi:hypothetical protein
MLETFETFVLERQWDCPCEKPRHSNPLRCLSNKRVIEQNNHVSLIAPNTIAETARDMFPKE